VPRFYARIAVCLFVAASWASCDDESGDLEGSASPPLDNVSTIVPVTPIEKPAGVPQAAEATVATTQLGAIERRAGQEPLTIDIRELHDANCEQDVMTFETSEETIYIASPCNGFWTDEQSDAFVEEEVAILLEVTEERYRMRIESVPGAQAEFTAAGIWVQ
jgi:hypothetical protein